MSSGHGQLRGRGVPGHRGKERAISLLYFFGLWNAEIVRADEVHAQQIIDQGYDGVERGIKNSRRDGFLGEKG